MKKFYLLVFAILLLSTTSISAATYCGETINSTNGKHTAQITCSSLGNNQYLFEFVSTDAFNGYNTRSNMYMNVNGAGGYQVSQHLTQEGNKLYAVIESNVVPNFYVAVFFVNYDDGEAQFNIPTDADFSQSCEGVETPTTPETPENPDDSETPDTPNTSDPTTYCQIPVGHQGDANFGDVNGRALLTLHKVNETSVKVILQPNYAAGALQKLDYLYVISGGGQPYPAEAGSDIAEGGVDELAVTITYETMPPQLNFDIQWSHPAWNGRWLVQLSAITPEQLCLENNSDDNEDPDDNQEMGLSNVKSSVKSNKIIENGQLYIINNGVRYNILGTCVNE